ncbi:MAG TPA: DUF1775 domain-containing protein [Herpetosiphonaceae bacterium]
MGRRIFGGEQRTRAARPIFGIVLALLLVLVGGGTARAHVGVLPGTVTPSTNLAFNIRVPNERDVPTVELRVVFPENLTVSRFQPKAGWQREVERDSAGRITAVVWSGGQIGSDEYEDFTFVGRTPSEPGVLTFKAYQTYQGGETVGWENPEGQDNPAPFVTVGQAAGAETETGPAIEGTAAVATSEAAAPAASAAVSPAPSVAPAGATSPDTEAAAAPAASTADSGSDLALLLALGALIVAVLALAVAGIALLRRRPAAEG